MLKTLFKLRILQVSGFLVLIAPLAFCFIKNRKVYFVESGSGLGISIGCILALIITIIVMLGHTKILKGITLYFLVFIMSYLFKSIINDIVLLSGCALIGKCLYKIFFEIPIARFKRRYLAEESADINQKASVKNTEMIVKAIKETRGRV